MRPGSCTLVLLSYDEREALGRLMPSIPFHLFDRTIAIDPGSTDGTLDLYRERGIEVFIQEQKGRGRAFVLGQSLVTTDLVIYFSTDGNEDPSDLPKILELLRQGYDMVIAGRFIRRGSKTDLSDDPLGLRWAGAVTFGLLVRLIYRSGVFDATNGYRGFRLDSMRRMRLDAAGHEIEYQSTIRAAKLGMRVVEISTLELERLGGARKPTASTLRLGWVTLRCLLREIALGRRFDAN